jgi:O-antigen/teichoic acid export membrane protein
LNTVIGYFLFAYKAALFSAHQRNDIISKLTITVNLVSNVLQIALLLLFRNYYLYVIVVPLATILTNLLNAYVAKKNFPDIVCRGTIDKEMKSGIKKRITGLLSFKIYGVIFSSVDTIVISSFLGLIALAKFNSYHYVQTALIGFLTILTTSITAGVGNKMVTCSTDDNYEDFKKIVFANAWISGFCSVCLFCLYQHFVEWWVGPELLFPFDTMIIMVLYFLLPRISAITFTYREAAGLWWEDRFRPLVAAVVNLVTNLILVQFIGMNGVIISTLICTIFINIPWGSRVLFKNYFKRSPIEYFLKLAFYILVTMICGAITFLICQLLPSQGIVYLIIKAVICVVVANGFYLIVYHRLSEFNYMKQLIISIFSKIKK